MVWGQGSGASTDMQARRNARSMRRGPTEAEKRLWRALRHDLPPAIGHFRRQAPIGPYVVDFVSLQAKLIIEVDGEQHGFEAERAHDQRRSHFFEAQGFRILRFWNRDVMRETRSVVDTILAVLGEHTTTPTPSPSPQGGGGWQASSPSGDVS